jgi:hypothetical protein
MQMCLRVDLLQSIRDLPRTEILVEEPREEARYQRATGDGYGMMRTENLAAKRPEIWSDVTKKSYHSHVMENLSGRVEKKGAAMK